MHGYRKWAVVFNAAILALLSSPIASAETIGLASSIPGWTGNAASVVQYDHSGTVQSVVKPVSPATAVEAYANFSEFNPSTTVSGWTKASYQVLKGKIDSGSDNGGAADYLWWSAGMYRDQIFFQTKNREPAALNIILDVAATGGTYDNADARAYIEISWYYYDGTQTKVLDCNCFNPYGDIGSYGPNASFKYSGHITLETSPWYNAPGVLVASDTYVPMRLNVGGAVQFGFLNWADTATFVGYAAFQQDASGNYRQLGPDEFAINGIWGAPVPEPSAVLMLCLGLLGLATVKPAVKAAVI
jgi:hypothetical protein